MASINREPCSFTADGEETVRFAATSITENGAIRVAPRDRPYRPGTKLDTTGAKGDTWDIESLFSNDIEEEGVTDDGGPQLYPDRIEQLVGIFKTGKTGTLNLPWRRGIRVKCGTWKRTDNTDPADSATFSCQFLEDNEDNLDREAIARPSPRAAMPSKVEETVFDAESKGTWSDDVVSLQEFTAGLVAIINAPNEFVQELDSMASGVLSSCAAIRNAFSTYVPGHDQFYDPDSVWLRINLLALEDLAAQAQWEARKRREQTFLYYPERDTDIWRVSAALRKDPRRMVDLNAPDFEDLGYIEAGTPVRVYVE